MNQMNFYITDFRVNLQFEMLQQALCSHEACVHGEL